MRKLIELQDVTKIRQGKVLVTTNGTFDILHVGHLRILQAARNMGDILLVLVNSDSSVKQNKGDIRPIVPEMERMEMLTGLECVDYVLLFHDKDVINTLHQIKPDIHVKGGSYIPERVKAEKDFLESYGGRHICLDLTGNYSTTNIIEKILRCYKA